MIDSLFCRFIPIREGPEQPLGEVNVTFGRLWSIPLVTALLVSVFALTLFICICKPTFKWSLVMVTCIFILIFLFFFCLNSFYHWWGFSRGLGSVVEDTAPSRMFFMSFVVSAYALVFPLAFARLLKTKLVVCVSIRDALFSWATSTFAPSYSCS